MKVNCCIVIPCYNTEKTIGTLIEKIRKVAGEIPIFVIDDGSTDDSGKIAKKFDGVSVIFNGINKGKGFSLRKGLMLAQKARYDYALVIDSDLQHPPEYLPDFILEMEKGFELIIGKRDISPKRMPLHRVLSNTITSFLISLRTGRRIHDSQCGFRAYKLGRFKNRLYKENGFQFETEYLLRNLGRKNFTICEVPIPTLYFRDISSKISIIGDTLRFIMLFFRSYLWV
ncbi:MAG: glycosyltransferase family 2 protein [Candidatus Marinimicrobia bacterium]|nr:glycosyltransferase family 2 protein [Candidatus Neomarinimicrobiota bacterium]